MFQPFLRFYAGVQLAEHLLVLYVVSTLLEILLAPMEVKRLLVVDFNALQFQPFLRFWLAGRMIQRTSTTVK